MNFLHKIISVFNTHAEAPAFCIQNKFYTYSTLQSLVSSIQQKINENCPSEQNIGIIIKDDLETYASILAIFLLGKTYIPIHPTYPIERATQIIEQAGIRYLLSETGSNNYPSVAVIATAADAQGTNTSAALKPFSIEKTNAYILFTSGSTGVPKGVPITYYNLDSFVNAFHALGYQNDHTDRFLQMFELTFDLSVMSYLIPLCTGACVYTIPDTGMKFTNIYNVLTAHKITFALMVPSVLANLRPYFEEIDLPDMRYSLFCGEALYKDVLVEWMRCVPNAVVENVYGPTEATIFCLTYKIPGAAHISDYNGIVTIGTPMQGMEAIVVDDAYHPLPDGEKGELCLYGSQLTPGYLNAEKTREAFFELDGKRYYRTGDIAFRNEDGNFIYCGRVDHQVKIQGFRVELSEIEFHLRAITGSSNVVALAMNSSNGLTQINVVFEGTHNDTTEIIEILKTKVPPYMIPAQVHFVATFPLNTSGKTDRKALQKLIG
jgi:amino acid adenylation domain-containing protein